MCSTWAILWLMLLTLIKMGDTIKCHIGYGQYGKLRSSGYEWVRDCQFSTYCWEATTTEKEEMVKLFDFAWEDYYNIYYVRGCSGDYGTDLKVNPFRKKPKPKVVKVNITTEPTIVGTGGTAEFTMSYACSHNYCGSASSVFTASTMLFTGVVASVTTVLVGVYM